MRLVLVAVGVSEYTALSSVSPITCAVTDAHQFFESIRRASGSQFDPVASTVLANPTAIEFRVVVELASIQCGQDGILVLYFSGHGEDAGGKLGLVCSDADGRGRGRVLSDELAALVRHSQALLVLDCCSSGGALAAANQADPIVAPRVSVIASARLAEPSRFDESGSEFTQSVCRAFDGIADSGESLTIQRLASLVQGDKLYGGRFLVNIAEGKSDLVLSGDSLGASVPPDFARRFIDNVRAAERTSREMMWYSLLGLPDYVQVKALREWMEHGDTNEASWLLRRAIGSVLGSLPNRSVERNLMATGLLDSESWMERSIGTIAVRWFVDQPAIGDALTEVALSDEAPMDLVWLAFLYLSDSVAADFDLPFHTRLPETIWGAIEIWDRHVARSPDFDSRQAEYFDRLRDAKVDEEALRSIATHIRLQRGSAPSEFADVDLDLISKPLVQHLYGQPPRGSVQTPSGKWLLSNLYGSWRGQVDARLSERCRFLRTEEVAEQLSAMSCLPSVALRMAIFQDTELLSLGDEIRESLEWALSDPHPWVRRVAVEALQTSNRAPALQIGLDRRLYPGAFDLLLSCALADLDWMSLLGRLALSPYEAASLSREVDLAQVTRRT